MRPRIRSFRYFQIASADGGQPGMISAISQGPQCLMSVIGDRSNSAIFASSNMRSSMSRNDVWQPKQPASEVVAMRTLGRAAVFADALI